MFCSPVTKGSRQGCVAMTTGIFAGLWDLVPCDNKEKYICKHLAEGAVLTPPPPTLSPPQCAEGWMRVGTRNVCSKVCLENAVKFVTPVDFRVVPRGSNESKLSPSTSSDEPYYTRQHGH